MDKDIPPNEKTTNQNRDFLPTLPWIILYAIILIGIVLYFCGFRFSYNPKLENSWIAISAVAAWASAVAALGAIVAAGIVAKRQNEIANQQREIMEQQNKISLFGKRYEAYSELVTLGSFAESIKGGEYLIDDDELTLQKITHKRVLICTVFGSIFGIAVDFRTTDKAKELEIFLAKLNERRNKAYMLPLLLPLACKERADMRTEITDMYDTMYALLSDIVVAPLNQDIYDKNRIELAKKNKLFFEKYREIFYKYLSY